MYLFWSLGAPSFPCFTRQFATPITIAKDNIAFSEPLNNIYEEINKYTQNRTKRKNEIKKHIDEQKEFETKEQNKISNEKNLNEHAKKRMKKNREERNDLD